MTTTVCVYETRYDITTFHDDDVSGSGGLNCFIHSVKTVGISVLVLHGCLYLVGRKLPFLHYLRATSLLEQLAIVLSLTLFSTWRFMSVV
jgi:hypothetical protein